jgi:glycosyltransferase involved in cell wall biosynthesis
VPAVNVIGYLRSESGVGQAARAVVAGLDAAGVPLLPIHPPDVPPSRQGVPFATLPPGRAAFGVNLLCVTAFETPGFAAAVGPRFFAGRHTIGLWWWEVDVFPEFMRSGFDHVDEVWAGTEHIARALRPAAGDVPVHVIHVPVVRPAPTTLRREDLGLPAEGQLFVTTFGYYSSVVRKNPAGVIEAFSRAFAPGEGPTLVVKCIDHEAHPEEHAQLAALAAGRPDVLLLPGYIDAPEMDALLEHADAVVSLHRAEGFGFTPAEAMALGKPVIATRYSGNLDYMDDDNSYLVDSEIVTIGEHGGPYPPEGHWAEPDLDHAATLMRRVASDPAEARARGARAAQDMAAGYGAGPAGATMRDRLLATGARDPRRPLARLRARRMAARRRSA